MKYKKSNIKKYKLLLPKKETFYTFLFNLVLLIITLVFGYLKIPEILQKSNFERLKEQNFIEKRNEFLKEFTYLGQSRIYLAERYYKNLEAVERDDVLKDSWDKYMNSVVLWNNTNLLNPIFIAYYFNNDAKDDYYNELQIKLVNLHEGLLELRDGKNIEEIDGEELIEEAKNELFSFSERMFFGGYD